MKYFELKNEPYPSGVYYPLKCLSNISKKDRENGVLNWKATSQTTW